MQIIAAILDPIGQPPPYATSEPLRQAPVALDPPRLSELFVRTKAAGVCHSDLSVINGDPPGPMPMAFRHPAVVTVEALSDIPERPS